MGKINGSELKKRKKYTKNYRDGNRKTVYAVSAYKDYDIPAIENVRCTTMPTYVGHTWETLLDAYLDILLTNKYSFMVNGENIFGSRQSREIIQYIEEMISKYKPNARFWADEFPPAQSSLINAYNTSQKIKNQNAKNSLIDGVPDPISEEELPLDFNI